MDALEPEVLALVRESYHVDWHARLEAGETLQCPYCLARFAAARGLTLSYGGRTQQGLFCPDCGSFRYLRLPDAAELAAKYERPDPHLAAEMATYVLGVGNALPETLRCLAALRPVGRSFRSVLDVGCGVGLSLLACRAALGCPAKGLEPSPAAAVGRGLLGVDVEQLYLEDFRTTHPERFDLVSANGVVEHVLDPVAFVEQLWAASHTAVSFLVPAAEGLAPETPGPRLYGCLAPTSHLTMMSEAGARALARRLGVAEVTVIRRGELMIVWFSREPLEAASEEELLDRVFDTALACYAAPEPLVREGGLNRLLVLTGAPRFAAWRAPFLALAEAALEAEAPGIVAGAAFDPAALSPFAYVTLFVGALEAMSRADRQGCLERLRATRHCIRHLRRARPLVAAHAINIAAAVDRTIAHLEAA